MIKKSFNYVKQDVIQISCVFMGISLISFDKWLLQFFAMTDLPIICCALKLPQYLLLLKLLF